MLATCFSTWLGERSRQAACGVVVAVFATLPNLTVAQSTTAQPQACQQLVEVLATEGRVSLDGVTFDFNRSSMRPDSLPALIAARDAILTLGGDWQLAGHTDDRGNREYNQRLSESRAMAVRDWLVGAGVPDAQLSAAGFSYDQPLADNATDEGRALNRRVELVGTVTPDMLGFGGPEGVDPCPATLIAGTQDDTPPPPPITEWTGTGGQEWLPFSYLMATGYGGGSGWEGDRISMPSGTQPQACQALCAADAKCAAFSFEPAGANFVETASCALIGYGTELNLRRDNGYLDGGIYHASGLKPDAMLLTPESEEVALALLADLGEIAELRAKVRITAPDTQEVETFMDVAVDGAVSADQYASYLEIAALDDYDLDWRKSKSTLFVQEMEDGRSGQLWVPERGDYSLRYVINHPSAGLHTIAEQMLHVPAGDISSVPDAGKTGTGASLSFPMMVEPGESITVSYTGPLHDGDWIDIIALGNDDDMSGGFAWAWATGDPVVLTAPETEADYTLRYVAEDPQTGRAVLASDTLIVRAPTAQTVSPTDILHRCEGTGTAPCELMLPAHDIAATLLPGYGITEPAIYVTPGGAAADRPSFDLVRLSDGMVVVMVNARQASVPYCQDNIAGDTMCVTSEITDADGMAVAFFLGSLTSAAMAAEFGAMGEDEAALPAGDLQGVWFVSFSMPGTVDDQTYFVVVELMQDTDETMLAGNFITAADLGPMPGQSGDVTGTATADGIELTMMRPDGIEGLVFAGTPFGGLDYMGEVTLAHDPSAPPIEAVLSKQAGPGEDWYGAPWMTNEADGMAAAVQIDEAALADMLGDLDGQDRAVAEMMATLMGAMVGAGTEPAHAQSTVSPTVSALGGKVVDLEGIPAPALIELIAPFQEIAQ